MVHCTRTASGHWWLCLRCGGCGTWHETFAEDDAVAALQQAIARLREVLALQIEAFSRALELDLITADDFLVAQRE